jgi:predicted GNAT family acetyltransferase
MRGGPDSVTTIVDGAVVAGASASRNNGEAAALWVHTDQAHRRRRYAAQVASAWAAGVTESGRVPFYSHLHDNHASRALATRLGLIPAFDLIGLTLDRQRDTGE